MENVFRWVNLPAFCFHVYTLQCLTSQLTGREAPVAEGVSAETLNHHYVLISTDPDDTAALWKCSAKPAVDDYFSEWQVFRMLDHLRPTATGLDALPAWFLKLGAPVFWKPIIRLYNLSIATSTGRRQASNQYRRLQLKSCQRITGQSQLPQY